VLTHHLITRRADEDTVDASVAERDYVLAHVVAQLHLAKPADGGQLVFKGGTAIRFVHLRDYRYSADLDFTVVGGGVEPAREALAEAVAAAKNHAGFPSLELSAASGLSYVGPLRASKPRTIKVDLATDEYIDSVEQGAVMPDLWSDMPESLPFDVYPVDEIAAEKLRCLIQRVQCRDLYDLLRLTEDLKVSLVEITPLFKRKATAKAIDPLILPERFIDRVERCKERWAREMGEHLADPPRFDDVVRIVRRHLRAASLI